MAEIKIERGVPLPSQKTPTGYYPWDEMEVGDSFFVQQSVTPPIRVRQAVSVQNDRSTKRYTARRTPDGIRVWRLS